MTIADNLNRIIQAKADIKTAIENKGVTVGNITIDGYANKINQITVGESGKTVLPNGICLSGSTWETFDTTQYDWSKVRSFNSMFNGCSNLTTINGIEDFDTSKVTNMNKMFDSCIILTSLDVSNWDTSKVTNMNKMFSYCSNLTSLDVSNWDTSKVTNMTDMFDSCSNLTSLDVSNWDTSKVTNMQTIFNSCYNLTSLDLANWDTSNVTNMYGMFKNCSNLTEVKMGGDVSKVTDVGYMFGNITSTGTFYYNPQYDYSKIIAVLPSTWTAVPME